MPLIIGEDRLIPGFEDNLVGLTVGDTKGFDITFPDDYGEESLAGKQAHFEVELRELREKVLPDADDDFARSMGDFEDLADLRTGIKERLERNALDKARHQFADKIIDYAVANATLDLPDILVDQEVEVMHDEFRSSLARQGITEEAYLKVTGKTDADLHADFRPDAEKRVKVLLVLSKVAEAEGVTISDADVDAEVERGRQRYAGDPKLAEVLRVGARPELHPLDAAPEPDRRAARRRLARRPSRAPGAARTSRTARAARSTSPSAEASARDRRHRPGLDPRHDDDGHDHDHDHDHAITTTPNRSTSRPRPADPTIRPAQQPSDTRETPDARADGHRILQPWGARLRHLLAAAAGADHLPRRPDRGPPREPVIAQLLFLESEDPEKDISLYINSPGGVVTSGLAIYDTMQYLRAPVSTICIGMAASMAAVLLAAGAKGKRYALPNSRIMIHQGSGGFRGAAPDAVIQMKEWEFLVQRNHEILAKHTGQPLEKVEQDTNRDYFMAPEDAKDYGIIDAVYSLSGDSLIAQAHDAGMSGGEGSAAAAGETADAGRRKKTKEP